LIQILVFFVVAAAYVIALLRPATIVYIILTAYGFTSQFFPLTLAVVYRWKVTAAGGIAALAAGFGMVSVFVFGPLSPPFGIHAGILGLAVNIPTMFVVSRYTLAREPNLI
jgi:SSS family solute:Na+ symporter